jgi:hypothetical protein
MNTTYTREGNDILAIDTNPDTGAKSPAYKVASISEAGNLRMANGQKDHKDAVEKFLAESGELEDEETPVVIGAPVEDQKPPVDQDGDPKVLAMPPPLILPGEEKEDLAEFLGGIPECPPEDPAKGDKTPAVIKWWFTYHPEEAATKYANRKFDRSILSNA